MTDQDTTARYERLRKGVLRRVELMAGGKMHTFEGKIDTTLKSLREARQELASIDRLLARHTKAKG